MFAPQETPLYLRASSSPTEIARIPYSSHTRLRIGRELVGHFQIAHALHLTMMMSITASAARRVSQQTARRQLSTTAAKEPKMHKAKGNWDDLMKKRPQDADDLHVSYQHRVHEAYIYSTFRIPYIIFANPLPFIPVERF
jgi:hypothetical protein